MSLNFFIKSPEKMILYHPPPHIILSRIEIFQAKYFLLTYKKTAVKLMYNN